MITVCISAPCLTSANAGLPQLAGVVRMAKLEACTTCIPITRLQLLLASSACSQRKSATQRLQCWIVLNCVNSIGIEVNDDQSNCSPTIMTVPE